MKASMSPTEVELFKATERITELEAEVARLVTAVGKLAEYNERLDDENERLRKIESAFNFLNQIRPDSKDFAAKMKDAERWRKGREKGWIGLGMKNEIDAAMQEEKK